MRKIQILAKAVFLLFGGLSAAGPLGAQTVTGTLGSPGATTTLSNKQLPATAD